MNLQIQETEGIIMRTCKNKFVLRNTIKLRNSKEKEILMQQKAKSNFLK